MVISFFIGGALGFVIGVLITCGGVLDLLHETADDKSLLAGKFRITEEK
jgi:hypothetical protein